MALICMACVSGFLNEAHASGEIAKMNGEDYYNFKSLASDLDDMGGKNVTNGMLKDWDYRYDKNVKQRLLIPGGCNLTLNMNGHMYNRRLTEGDDYDIAYGKVISNKAKVTVAGKGNYTGSISETFVIGGDRPAKKYTITFDLNGGKLNGVKGVIKEKHYENTIVKLRKPSRSGYKFKYWKGKVNGKVKKYKAGTRLKVKGNRTYKAIWKKKAVYKKPLAVMKSKGDDSFEITWTKVKGASGYDIFFSACNTKYKKHKPKKVATAGKSAKRIFKINVLKKHVAYKAYVKGSCKIYAVAANGASKKIKVKVR